MTGIDDNTAYLTGPDGAINMDLWQTLDQVNDFLNQTKVLNNSFAFVSFTNFDGR